MEPARVYNFNLEKGDFEGFRYRMYRSNDNLGLEELAKYIAPDKSNKTEQDRHEGFRCVESR